MSSSRSPCTTASPKLPPTSPLRQERCGRRIESRPAVVRSANFRHRAPQIAPRLRDPVSATGPLIGQFRQSTRSRDRDQQSQSRRSCQIQTPRIGKDAATVGGTWVEGASVWGISAPLYPWRGWGVGAVISALISAWACWDGFCPCPRCVAYREVSRRDAGFWRQASEMSKECDVDLQVLFRRLGSRGCNIRSCPLATA